MRIYQTPCRCSDWTISMWHINPKWQRRGPFIRSRFLLSFREPFPGETLHCDKRFAVVRGDDPDEGLFEKLPAPPPPEIQNSTASPSAPGDPIEAGVFNTSNRAEDISLVRNQGLEVDDDMELAPGNVPLDETHVWGADMGVGWHWSPCCVITESEWAFLQKWLDPPNPFLHQYIPTLFPSKMI